MGVLNKFKNCMSSPYAVANSNPDPSKFKIINEEYHNGYLVLMVDYPDCTNFEGRKLLVYEGFENSQQLIKFNLFKLDPHFADRRGSPIARFKPTDESLILIERMIGK